MTPFIPHPNPIHNPKCSPPQHKCSSPQVKPNASNLTSLLKAMNNSLPHSNFNENSFSKKWKLNLKSISFTIRKSLLWRKLIKRILSFTFGLNFRISLTYFSWRSRLFKWNSRMQGSFFFKMMLILYLLKRNLKSRNQVIKSSSKSVRPHPMKTESTSKKNSRKSTIKKVFKSI